MNNSVFTLEYVALLLRSDPLSAFETWKQFFREAKDNGDFQICYQLLQEIKHLALPSKIVAEIRYQEGLLQYELDNWQVACRRSR